jgi:hypothetical protein
MCFSSENFRNDQQVDRRLHHPRLAAERAAESVVTRADEAEAVPQHGVPGPIPKSKQPKKKNSDIQEVQGFIALPIQLTEDNRRGTKNDFDHESV